MWINVKDKAGVEHCFSLVHVAMVRPWVAENKDDQEGLHVLFVRGDLFLKGWTLDDWKGLIARIASGTNIVPVQGLRDIKN